MTDDKTYDKTYVPIRVDRLATLDALIAVAQTYITDAMIPTRDGKLAQALEEIRRLTEMSDR